MMFNTRQIFTTDIQQTADTCLLIIR